MNRDPVNPENFDSNQDSKSSGIRGLGQLLLDRKIAVYFTAKLFSNIGVWIHNIVAAIYMFELTQSAFLVGLVSVFQFTPILVLSLFTGALADRGGRRMQAVIGRGLSATGSGVLAILLSLENLPSSKPALLLAAAALVGLGFAISTPALHALYPTLVKREELQAMVAIDTTPMTIARATGPGLGALLFAIQGPVLAFSVAAILQVTLAVVISAMHFSFTPRSSGSTSVFGAILHIRQDPPVGLLLLAVLGVGFAVDPVVTLTPALSMRLGGGAGLVATMASAFGLGSAVTPLLLGALRKRWAAPVLGCTGLAVLAACLALLGLTPVVWGAVAAMFVGGFGMMLAMTCVTAQLQFRMPDHLRGRIMALWTIGFTGSRPIAAAVNGALADAFSVGVAFLVISLVVTVFAYLSRPSRVDRPGPPTPVSQ